MASDSSDNPILDMGLLGMMQPNRYINPAYAGKPLSLPGFYTGPGGGQPPTDAYGKPIQSFVDANNAANTQYAQQMAAFNAAQPAQGTTLNTPGPAGSGAPSSAQLQAANIASNPANQNQGGFGSGNNVLSSGALAQIAQLGSQIPGGMQGGGSGAPAAAGPTPPAPPNMRQAYLDALANPGPLAKPGANVPVSSPLGTPSVMNAFMAAHPTGGAKGAGGYNNSGFFNTLSNLRGA